MSRPRFFIESLLGLQDHVLETGERSQETLSATHVEVPWDPSPSSSGNRKGKWTGPDMSPAADSGYEGSPFDSRLNCPPLSGGSSASSNSIDTPAIHHLCPLSVSIRDSHLNSRILFSPDSDESKRLAEDPSKSPPRSNSETPSSFSPLEDSSSMPPGGHSPSSSVSSIPGSFNQNSSASDVSRGKKKPLCVKCKYHGDPVPVKGHKNDCPYRNCTCPGCSSNKELKVVRKKPKSDRAEIHLKTVRSFLEENLDHLKSHGSLKYREYKDIGDEGKLDLRLSTAQIIKKNHPEHLLSDIVHKALENTRKSTNNSHFNISSASGGPPLPIHQLRNRKKQLIREFSQNQSLYSSHDSQNPSLAPVNSHSNFSSSEISQSSVAAKSYSNLNYFRPFASTSATQSAPFIHSTSFSENYFPASSLSNSVLNTHQNPFFMSSKSDVLLTYGLRSNWHAEQYIPQLNEAVQVNRMNTGYMFP